MKQVIWKESAELHLHDAVWERLRLRIEQESKADVKAIKLALDTAFSE